MKFAPQRTQSYAMFITCSDRLCLSLTKGLSMLLGNAIFITESSFTSRNLASSAVNKGFVCLI